MFIIESVRCVYPFDSSAGMQQLHELGVQLRTRYVDDNLLIPYNYSRADVYVRYEHVCFYENSYNSNSTSAHFLQGPSSHTPRV